MYLMCLLAGMLIGLIVGFVYAERDFYKSKYEKDTERFGYCKSPTYPAPQKPGTSSYESMKNIKPPKK